MAFHKGQIGYGGCFHRVAISFGGCFHQENVLESVSIKVKRCFKRSQIGIIIVSIKVKRALWVVSLQIGDFG